MNEDKKPLKVHFMPGCFDNFEGTQEELDALIAEITLMAESGAIQELGEELDIDSFLEDLTPEEANKMAELFTNAFEDDADAEDEEPTYNPSQDWSGTGRRLH